MTPRALRILRGLSTWHNLCWIVLMFMITHFIILKQAMEQVRLLSDDAPDIRQLVLWDPDALPEALARLTEDIRTLYITIEVSAGLIESLLIAMVCLSALMYLFFRFKPDKQLLRWCLALVCLLLISDLTFRLGLIATLRPEHGDPSRQVTLLRLLALLKLLGLLGCVVCAIRMLPATMWRFMRSGNHVNTS